MNTIRNRMWLALLAMSLLLVGGCKTNEEGVTNRVGTIKATLAANPAAVTEAAKQVLEDLDLVIINASSTAIDGRVVARTAQDVKVRVDSERVGDNVSEVFIRVGTLGDTDLSLTILNEIKEELGIASGHDDDDDSHADDEDEDDHHDGEDKD